MLFGLRLIVLRFLARRTFEYRRHFCISLGMSLPHTLAFGLQYQLKPSLEVLFVGDDETLLKGARTIGAHGWRVC